MKNNKKAIFIVLIIMLLAVSQSILTRKLGDLDELWNYNFARNILEGKLPYRDFNMVQTPLFPMISAVFLAVLGNELIVMRIIAIIIATSILFMCYKILEILKIHKIMIYVVLIGMYILLVTKFMADYNWFTLLITLIIMYLELLNLEKTQNILNFKFKNDFFIRNTCRDYNFIKTNNRNFSISYMHFIQNSIGEKQRRF